MSTLRPPFQQASPVIKDCDFAGHLRFHRVRFCCDSESLLVVAIWASKPQTEPIFFLTKTQVLEDCKFPRAFLFMLTIDCKMFAIVNLLLPDINCVKVCKSNKM